ncbi:Putative signal transducing protein [Polaribacter sp. KT25b]|uniref:putative signal transducing protein n=1 Tax=Polaribacter sp. KT25b TaxID=1855336 RepID=UPI00087A1993|nr:DUF2007 domain-containing protein [Polaribacter sp. KT25b]SDS42057.1 Putative signal transducing protein [Polaribacter sp. KT25b]
MSLITIKKSNNESEIFILKGRLESEGVKCYLRNQFSTQIMPQISSVELQISEVDSEKVKEILSQINQT